MDIDDLVTVYTLNNPIEAEMVKNMLRDEGIRCFLNGLEQADNVGLPLQEIQVQVQAADADRATKLLQRHDEHRKET